VTVTLADAPAWRKQLSNHEKGERLAPSPFFAGCDAARSCRTAGSRPLHLVPRTLSASANSGAIHAHFNDHPQS